MAVAALASPPPWARTCGNRILDALPADEFERLVPALKRVALSAGEVIQRCDTRPSHVYFPTTALGSILATLDEDDPVEIGMVGNDGVIGLAPTPDLAENAHRAICRLPGEALALRSDLFAGILARGPALSRLVHRYEAYSLRMAGLRVACQVRHPVERRLCSWLLMAINRAGIEPLPLTQESLADVLGVRRQTVVMACGALRNAGLIGGGRGMIAVRDRPGLEAWACECYRVSHRSYERLFG